MFLSVFLFGFGGLPPVFFVDGCLTGPRRFSPANHATSFGIFFEKGTKPQRTYDARDIELVEQNASPALSTKMLRLGVTAGA